MRSIKKKEFINQEEVDDENVNYDSTGFKIDVKVMKNKKLEK